MQKLTTGDDFQNLTLNLTDGSTLELPKDIDTDFAIVLFYRGHW
jgi:peroxiredoxin